MALLLYDGNGNENFIKNMPLFWSSLYNNGVIG